jgi:lysophospholipase L1-like esterase
MIRIKNFLYSALAIIIIFSLIEGVLFVCKAGGETGLLQEFTVDNTTYLEVNTHYMYRYFSNTNVSIPTLCSHYFSKKNNNETFRVYVIGESSSQGFPYAKTESFPYLFQQMLQKALPGKEVEVINFSVSAGNTQIGLDMVEDLLKYPPDLFVTFYGHNEFIGIGGAKQYSSFLFKCNLLCNQLRSYRVLKRVISVLTIKKENSLFEEMSLKKPIAPNSKRYYSTLSQFDKNYREIVTRASAKNVPVIIMGVVSNLKDMPPFKTTEEIEKNDIEKTIRDFHIANQKITKETIDATANMNSLIYFELGRKFLLENDSVMAKYAFSQACTYDLGRFRATNTIHKMVETISKELNITYIDLQTLFNKSSYYHIAGNDLLLEHVHPTIDGHCLAASVLVDSVLAMFDFIPENEDFKTITITNSLADSVFVLGRINTLFNTNMFKSISFSNIEPFKGIYHVTQSGNNTTFKVKETIPEKEYNYILETLKTKGKELDSDNLHVQYGVWLFNQKRYKEAHREFYIAHEQDPYNCKAINNLAIMEYKSGKTDKAIHLLNIPIARKIYNKLICRNLWIILREQKKMPEAKEIKKLIEKKKLPVTFTENLTLAY